MGFNSGFKGLNMNKRWASLQKNRYDEKYRKQTQNNTSSHLYTTQ